MSLEDLARAWDDGYCAGVGDEERCEHRSWWLSRLVWRLSRGYLSIERGKCFLYATPNPFRPEEAE